MFMRIAAVVYFLAAGFWLGASMILASGLADGVLLVGALGVGIYALGGAAFMAIPMGIAILATPKPPTVEQALDDIAAA